ncbi:MAG: glycosyltransferase family 4 protein [Dehalococcoidia bacterium]|nr:glycosyltransferase family 4 protein [Dehalococcoidia bacterium]
MTRRALRLDIALVTLAGNRTRYLGFRPVVDGDREVSPRWVRVRTYAETDWTARLPSFLRMRVRNVFNLAGLLLHRPPDATIIHAYGTLVHYGLLHWALRRCEPIVYWYDGAYAPGGTFASPIPLPTRGLREFLRKKVLGRITVFVPWSNFTAAMTADAFPAAAARTVVVHPGIDLTRWEYREPTPHEGSFRLLFVGADFRRKGGDLLLRLFERGALPGCELDVVTSPAELAADDRERLEATAGIRLHLGLEPTSPELRAIYRAADCFVLPTSLDLSSLAALEAMASGLPVVISGVGGIPDIVVHQETGLIARPAVEADWVQAIDRLRSDVAFRQQLAARARAHAEQHFDSRINGARILALTRAAAARTPRSGKERRPLLDRLRSE